MNRVHLVLPESDKAVYGDILRLCEETQAELLRRFSGPTSDPAEIRRRREISRAVLLDMVAVVERDYSQAWAVQARQHLERYLRTLGVQTH